MNGYWFNQSGGGGESPFPPIPPSGVIEGCRQVYNVIDTVEEYMTYLPREYTSDYIYIPPQNDIPNSVQTWDGLYGEYPRGVYDVPNVHFFTRTRWVAELANVPKATIREWLADIEQWFDETRPLPLKGNAALSAASIKRAEQIPTGTAKFNKHYIGTTGSGGFIGGNGVGRREFLFGNIYPAHPLTIVASNFNPVKVRLQMQINDPYLFDKQYTVSLESGTYHSSKQAHAYNILEPVSYAQMSEVYVIKV